MDGADHHAEHRAVNIEQPSILLNRRIEHFTELRRGQCAEPVRCKGLDLFRLLLVELLRVEHFRGKIDKFHTGAVLQ